MTFQASKTPGPSAIGVRSRPSSVSAIPRPTSGTSRHATPTSITRGGDSESSASAMKGGRGQKKPWLPNDGAPPSSFHIPKFAPTASASLLPYDQREQKDLSGTRQQLFIRNLSMKSLNSADISPSPPPPPAKQAPAHIALPKSKTMSNILPSPRDRDITPRRRLMQPLGPPLPRTQTLGNMSCFGPPSTTPSPRKPTSVSVSQPQKHHDDAGQLNVTDALVESRMTDKELQLMIQVQREAAANRTRLRNVFPGSTNAASSNSLPSSGLLTSTEEGNISSPTTRISVKDVANPRCFGGIRRKSSSGRMLLINPTLANENCFEDDLPSTTTTVTTATASSDTTDSFENVAQQV
jgi:hypothetical protein